jgi:STE24 endopeptidase
MIWYVIFFLTVVFGSFAPATMAADWIEGFQLPAKVLKPLSLVAFAGGFFLIFGYLSRRFERQADVYAARVMEAGRGTNPAVLVSSGVPVVTSGASVQAITPWAAPSHVGPYGAQVFASALHRVAHINNIPVVPRTKPRTGVLRRMAHSLGSLVDLAHDWLHGSIPHRMAYLQDLSTDPASTGRFDRVMTRLYCTLLFALFATLAWTLFGLGNGM